MSFGDFVTPGELQLIRRDANEILNSGQAVNLIVNYQVPVSPVYDSVYDKWNAASWTPSTLTPRAIQKIVGERDIEILRWAYLEKGDCIFYLSESIDLSVVQYGTCTITVGSSPIVWLPAPYKMKAFYNYLIFRMGDKQIWQAIPCKLKH